MRETLELPREHRAACQLPEHLARQPGGRRARLDHPHRAHVTPSRGRRSRTGSLREQIAEAREAAPVEEIVENATKALDLVSGEPRVTPPVERGLRIRAQLRISVEDEPGHASKQCLSLPLPGLVPDAAPAGSERLGAARRKAERDDEVT